MGAEPVVARAALHMWEEPCVSGKNGSGTVFFSGCNLQCVYCQNYEISASGYGKQITVEQLSEIFKNLVNQGAHNINLVTPTHFILPIIEALKLWKPPVPVIYNSSGYETVESLRLLDGYIDVYLPDLKYISDTVSEKYSLAKDYFSFASPALEEMYRQVGNVQIDSDGMIKRGVLIRHLILPENTRNSIAVLNWIKTNHPDAWVSLMAQYTPCGKAENIRELSRRITKREYDKVLDCLFELSLNGYTQERKSAEKDFIPPFNLEGVDK